MGEGSPAPRWSSSSRLTSINADGVSYYRGHESLRDNLAALSIGTEGPACYSHAQSLQGHARAIDQKDSTVQPRSMRPRLPRFMDARVRAQSQLVRAQLQCQGCREPGHGACMSSPVFPTGCVSREQNPDIPVPRRGQRAQKVTTHTGNKEAAQIKSRLCICSWGPGARGGG